MERKRLIKMMEEYIEVTKITEYSVKARKSFKCDMCSHTIWKGRTYTRRVYKVDGQIQVDKFHEDGSCQRNDERDKDNYYYSRYERY